VAAWKYKKFVGGGGGAFVIMYHDVLGSYTMTRMLQSVCIQCQKRLYCIWRDNIKNNLLHKINFDFVYCGMRTEELYHKKCEIWLLT
jgi:hypothetical protein